MLAGAAEFVPPKNHITHIVVKGKAVEENPANLLADDIVVQTGRSQNWNVVSGYSVIVTRQTLREQFSSVGYRGSRAEAAQIQRDHGGPCFQ